VIHSHSVSLRGWPFDDQHNRRSALLNQLPSYTFLARIYGLNLETSIKPPAGIECCGMAVVKIGSLKAESMELKSNLELKSNP
jgi:hypothetical protein